MSTDRTELFRWDPQLSDREIYFIGTVFVHWASMEHEVFLQTLATYAPADGEQPALPKEMNNLQFTGVVALWKERVVDKAKGRRAKVLQEQYSNIVGLTEARNALAHGKWHWSPQDLGRISTVRIKKREVITSHFSVDFLQEFADKVAAINFRIRYPGGIADLARARMSSDPYISRRALAMFTGAPFDGTVLPRNVRADDSDPSKRR